MARAIENPHEVPGYVEFFGMTAAPFARVSDPAHVFHAEQYSLLYAHLCDATLNADRMLLLCGADGSGKTTLLNRYIASLGDETSFASFDENCADGTQFYYSLLRQLGFSEITGTLGEFRNISKEFLIHRGLAGDPVLLIIDNAHLVSPSILEQLRELAGIKLKGKSVISLVLSGSSDLARIMASPAMRLLKFGRQVEFNIRVFAEQETDEYVRHRLRLAGGSESAKLASEARPLIHRFSGGNPRLINRFCDALLSEARNKETRIISESLVRFVADEQQFVPHVVPLKDKGRRKSDHAAPPPADATMIEERISLRKTPPQPAIDATTSEQGRIEVDVKELLSQVARISDELEVSRAQADKYLLDVEARDGDISALLDKIAQQSKDLERISGNASDQASEIERLAADLQESQQLNEALKSDLKVERRTANKTETALGRASRKLEKLRESKAELQISIRKLKSEKRKDATDARRNLKARDKTITELESANARLQKENETLQTRVTATDEIENELAKKAALIAEMQTEMASYVEELTATQAQLAHESSGPHSLLSLPDLDVYLGDIVAIEIYRHDALIHVHTLLPGQKRLMIGRSEDSELCLQSKFVSRHHALVYFAKQRAYIEDLRSYNGTVVNGKKISRCDLGPDDTILVGDFELRPKGR